MIKVFKHDELGRVQNDWLDSRHHFSFGHYHNPDRMGFGKLRVINDDVIKAGTGFDFHPHKNMEIITYVRSGTIIHRDSLDNKGRTEAGDVQVMSAGTGIVHAEHADPNIETRIFQIWILPNEKDVTPRWEAAEFPKDPVKENLNLLVSGFAEDQDSGALKIHQNAAIYGGAMEKGTELTHISRNSYVYVLVSRGTVSVNGTDMNEGDGAELIDEKTIRLKAETDSEILLLEV